VGTLFLLLGLWGLIVLPVENVCVVTFFSSNRIHVCKYVHNGVLECALAGVRVSLDDILE
jgi:hypothetical protein